MTPRGLADYMEMIEDDWYHKTECIVALRAQADEIDLLTAAMKRAEQFAKVVVDQIDALKAAAIVQGSIKLDEAVKVALERERRAAEIDALRSEAILRGIQIKNLMAEIQRLKAEMSVHETPEGGVTGMLTITPEAAQGLMEE